MTPGPEKDTMTPRHEHLLIEAERNLRAIDRDLAASSEDHPQLLEDRERTAEALQDLRERRFSGAVMALMNARVRR